MTAWQIYWVMQLDSIRGLFTEITAFGGILAALAFCGAPFWMDKDVCAPAMRKWIVGIPTTILLVGATAIGFLPSTKTAAAMIVLPAIANSETLRKEAGELYGLAKEALRDAIDAPEPKEQSK